MDVLTDVLKKLDAMVCTQPEKLPQYYGNNFVIMFDDKRIPMDGRIKGYRQMISEFRQIKCVSDRKVLGGSVGKQIGYVLVDEIISVTSKSSDTDERQHSVCSYTFKKENSGWKIVLEHCSSLPDISIAPGQDALYYFHNPIY